ncbi:helix-turn-helix domain-containing protein [Brucella intermedia]|uniref:helix-turn-helix domain-containing protein n=1 Tax=Brucella intermedia TaxID=94625 RepID=UPI00158A90A1|nr:XRE family transcriptional regulator [Brucella intermedia]NYD84176.1 Zn-dependent peptidase ImmA (M78 family)/DNA-binding XRE family transcriptional regulator [Brucella intermedia]
MFNGKRLSQARKRQRLTAKELAERTGKSPVTITRLETGQNQADADTLSKLADVLGYPVEFFFKEDPALLSSEVVSFRSLSSMTAKERNAALSAGDCGVELYEWLERNYNLPRLDLPPFDPSLTPEAAAEALRQHWGLGYQPISNLIKLIEAKGIRVLSLEESTANVDAFSFWQGNEAFVFLNSYKSAERSVFDTAHELGHLVLHKHGKTSGVEEDARTAEIEANRFASSFLMPEEDIRARIPRLITANLIIRAKKRWRVSAMALAYRLHHLSKPLLTEWQYRSICIELGKRGYRTKEPDGIEREVSVLWSKVLSELWSERKSLADIADELLLPRKEVEKLLFGILPQTNRSTLLVSGSPKLTIVR